MATVDRRPNALSIGATGRNFFLPVQSEFIIQRLPGIEFHCQSAELPGLSMRPVEQHNPFTPIRHAGDVVMFDEFSVEFKVDEYMKNYWSVWDWIIRLGFPEDHEQYRELKNTELVSELEGQDGGLQSDCSIHFLDSRGRGGMEAVFIDAFPIALSPVRVDSRATETDFVTARATFAYTRFSLRTMRPDK